MPTLPTALFASRGPFGPTYLTCLLLPVVLLGPFVLLAVAARSLLSAEPLARWVLAVAAVGAGGLGFVLWQEGLTRNVSGFWAAWRVAGGVAVLLTPAVFVREAVKRGWVPASGRWE
jgi:drug/metabolite transporter (DMT)-like permease